MKTLYVTMDGELAARVDDWAKRLGATPAQFAEQALRDALTHCEEADKEDRQQTGYRRKPPTSREFAIPDEDRAWGNDASETW